MNAVAPRIFWATPAERAESDCACPDDGATPDSFVDVDAGRLWQRAAGLYRDALPSDHELVFNPLGAAGVVVLNDAARAQLDRFAQPRALDDEDARRLARLNLLHPYGAPPPRRSPPQTLTAWLHVTNACNLRCTYCYLAKTNEAMDEPTGRAALEAIFRSARRHGFRAVKLKYAGGEATLNLPLVRILHPYALQLAQQQGLVLRTVLLSNGIALTRPLLEFVRNEDIHLSISLDGLGASHDAQRVFANGRGSAALVSCGIQRALDYGVHPHLSITLTRHNAAHAAEAVSFALKHDLLFNLNFYREHNVTEQGALAAENDALIQGARAAFEHIETCLPRRSLIASLVDRASFNAPHDRVCGAGHNYLVIDHRGRVSRCQMEIERSVTDVLADDPLDRVRGERIGFQNIAVDEKEGCRACTWRYWCAGGCPLLTYRVTGRSDVKSPYCNVYTALYPDILRLEGLRLLKWEARAA